MYLNLSKSRLSSAAVIKLVQNCKNLQTLTLSNSTVDDDAIQAISELGFRLTGLYLENINKIRSFGNIGCRSLAKLINLKTLCINTCSNITDDGNSAYFFCVSI